MDEIDRINSAIDCFAAAIKSRMADKYHEDYRGWDGNYPETALISEIISDAKNVEENIPIEQFKMTCSNILKRKMVDIGARAMMLWYRP